MAAAIVAGLSTAFVRVNFLKDFLASIRDMFGSIDSILPSNRLVKVVVYAAGGMIVVNAFPYVMMHFEFMAYFYRQKSYFHRANPYVTRKKEILLGRLRDGTETLPRLNDEHLVILEINAGGGSNLTYYPDGCTLITTDITPDQEALIRQNFDTDVTDSPLMSHITYERFLCTFPNELNSVPDCSVSAVVCFHGLCSACNVPQALVEIKRVLMPGGKYYFIEHVPDERFTRKWFELMYVLPAFVLVACVASRPVHKMIPAAGFSEVQLELYHEDLERTGLYPLKVLSRHVFGYAVK